MFAIAALLAVGLGVLMATSLPRLRTKDFATLLGSPRVDAGVVRTAPPASDRLCRSGLRHRHLQCVLGPSLHCIWYERHSSSEPLRPARSVGLVGVAAANAGGRVIDRVEPRRSLPVGLLCCVLAFMVFTVDVSLRGLIAGVVLLDFGLSVANVSNQSMIMGLEPEARSRINTIFETAIFLGGAIGSAAASTAWALGGWPAVCAFGLSIATLALAIHLVSARTGKASKASAAT